MKLSQFRLSGSHVSRRWTIVLGLVALAALLQVAAGVGLSYVEGFSAVHHVLERFSPIWLAGIGGGIVISFVGYYLVYSEIYKVKGGPKLSRGQMASVVIAGFGGFLAHGGAALDEYALEGAGAKEREAKVRVAALGGLEHGILGLGGCAAAVAILLLGLSAPPLDFSVPWAVAPIPGFLVAFWLAKRNEGRWRDAEGWRRKVGIFIDSILLIRAIFRRPIEHLPALAGMSLFWAADLFAAWCGLAMFGFRMNGAQFIVGMGTGMIFSRRTGPLGGAGLLTLVLAVTVMYSGAPFAVAIAGIFAYRVLAMWVPMPFSLASLPTLRAIGEEKVPGAEGTAGSDKAEPALGGQVAS